MSDGARHEMTRAGFELVQVRGVRPGRKPRVRTGGEIAYTGIYHTETLPEPEISWTLCEWDAKHKLWVSVRHQPRTRELAEAFMRVAPGQYRIERRALHVPDTEPRQKLDCVSLRDYLGKGRR
jgi:hypothetical protein